MFGFRIALVVGDEHLLLLLEESEHLIIFELKVVTDEVPRGLLELLVDLRIVSFAEFPQYSPEHLANELT